MNPCPDRLESLSLLAAQALPADESAELQQHLALCPGCAQRHGELVAVSASLHPPIFAQPPARLAERIASAVAAGGTPAATETARPPSWWIWPVGLGLAAALALLLARPSEPPRVLPPVVVLAPTLPVPPPTALAYQQALARSEDAFQELLDRHAATVLVPDGPLLAGQFEP